MTTQPVPALFGFSARGWLALSVPVAVNAVMTLDVLLAPEAGAAIQPPAPAEVTVVQALPPRWEPPPARATPVAVAAARVPASRPKVRTSLPGLTPDGATAAERMARTLAVQQLDEVLAEAVQTLAAAAQQARVGSIEYGDLPDLQREVLLQIEAVIEAQSQARMRMPASAHAALDAKVAQTLQGPLERWQAAMQAGQLRQPPLVEMPQQDQPAVEIIE